MGNIYNATTFKAAGELAPHVVISHDNCMDGLGSLLAFQLAAEQRAWVWDALMLNYSDTDNAELMDRVIGATAGRTVYMLDFSFKRDWMKKLLTANRHTIVLDHHKTAEAELADLRGLGVDPIIMFDMAQCGAVLAWRYLHAGLPVPTLFRYIQARDLWQWESVPDAREVDACIRLLTSEVQGYENQIGVLRDLLTKMADDILVDDMVNAGRALLRQRSADCQTAARSSKVFTIGDRQVAVMNQTGQISEVGEAMLRYHPHANYSASYFIKAGSLLAIFSLRSRVGDGVDVSEVAKTMGGGGHACAAGCQIRLNAPTPAQAQFLQAIGMLG